MDDMKLFTRYILSVGLILMSQFCFAQAQHILEVRITNIELMEGELYLSLTSDSTQFPRHIIDEKYRKTIKVDDSVMLICFTNIPEGFYALAVFQDLNGNAAMDTKKFGLPAEPFAFSNAAIRKFAPPYFEQAKFEISRDQVHREELRLIYKKPKKKDHN